MSQNVTQYEYMLKDSTVKENCISWVTNLRTNSGIENASSPRKDQEGEVISNAPSVFYKPTQSFSLKVDNRAEKDKFGVNTAEFSQFFGKDSTHIH